MQIGDEQGPRGSVALSQQGGLILGKKRGCLLTSIYGDQSKTGCRSVLRGNRDSKEGYLKE